MAEFFVENFGCRAARADGEAISAQLRSAGHCLQQAAEADVVIVNTCSVTAEADREARAFIRRTHRQNPQARIVVTGCYAQRAPAELAAMEGVAAVIGNSHKALAPGLVRGLLEPAQIASAKELVQIESAKPQGSRSQHEPSTAQAVVAPPQVVVDDAFAHSFLEEDQVTPGEQTRPNLKIQEGCSNHCTFCVIPATRGPSRSLPSAAVLKQVEGFIAAGGNELVLSGINLGRWGRDGGESHSLAWLVRRIFTETPLPRLRLSSIEPMDWNAELVGLMQEYGSSRLARHVHLPLQSGSDAVLRRMHRRYRPWHYVQKVEALLAAAGEDLTLGADVMVGFPGETDAEFEETAALIRQLPFGYLHLFPFSSRPGTPGEALHAAAPVAAGVVEERMAALRVLAAEKMAAHRARFVGRTLRAITLRTPARVAALGRTAALSENFVPMELEGALAANHLVNARVRGLTTEGSLEAESA
ncbi:tRNA (N(6)-L-threonylcarbamoyladenosine(37)-C(2))-methylthiotransferase MtaB [Telmatobacter bradus]|uniref:tRNA (N(6)-L-threonylcarbamoyladenosine(37)-C(2))- methylthiotransferase MtaB n=1 Tax=Telmatobacter bradus TaxID=474953 RepID=UPI003B4278F1